MADFSDARPVRWWVLDPQAHDLSLCSRCLQPLDLTSTVPMEHDAPLCAVCAGAALTNVPMTATYLDWLSTGDPRWWSPWMCNCLDCDAQGVL